ncbi:SIS domain-containing protein, partial [Candidatus Saccharibacteria bacterium]|nr:SIS domain-containing protein [Candidatus Saccharibacteria bacterium]
TTSIPTINKIVVAGMGGSALAAEIAKDWLNLPVPFMVVKNYELPAYVDEHTLLIACSFSGNTEETLWAYDDAKSRGAHIVIAAGKGKLLELAQQNNHPYVVMTYDGTTPRMFVLENLRAFMEIFVAYKIVQNSALDELQQICNKLSDVDEQWGPRTLFADNLAKQLAWQATGKTQVVYAGILFRSIAYKWKISFNESGKNIAFCNEYPEANHNEFIGWTSHPIEKPYAVFDIRSSFDHPRIAKRFELSDRLLSGKRPKSTIIELQGDSVIEQMVWGILLADYTSTYLGILNGVDPAPVPLIEKLKEEMSKS